MNKVCPFFGRCGGCLHQNLSAEEYKTLKLKFVQDALSYANIDADISPMIEIGAHTRRRATFAYQNGVFGFNELHSHKIVPITQCFVLTPKFEALLPDLQQLVKSFVGSGDLAVLMTDFGADITVVPKKEKTKRYNKKTSKNPTQDIAFLEKVTSFCQTRSVARFIYDDEVLFQSCTLPYPANVFMQPSVEGQATLVDLVLKATTNSKKVLDLFCGLGTFTKPLHLVGKKVLGMDITEKSIEALNREGVPAEVRDLFRAPVLPSELNEYDTVVLDPARAGAKAQCEQLAMSDVARVVMVSCNPQTFARDCRILLNGGYQIKWITPVDQFIYSNHIELVCLLERA